MTKIHKIDIKGITPGQAILVTGNVAKIIIDTDDQYTIATGDGLELKEGYVLNVQKVSIEDNEVHLELTKDGNVVDTKVVPLSVNDVYVYEGESDVKDKYPLIIARIDEIFRDVIILSDSKSYITEKETADFKIFFMSFFDIVIVDKIKEDINSSYHII